MVDAGLLAPFLPELLVLGAALLIFLLDSLGIRQVELDGAIAVGGTLSALLFVVADLGVPFLDGLRTVSTGSVDALPSISALYTFTSLGLVFQAIFLTSAFFVALASVSHPSDERGSAVYFGLLLLATLGMLLVALAADLIFLLLAVEVTSISTYLLVGYTRRDPRGLEAAMKFYIIGALSTALSFYGASLLFGAYGATNFRALLGAISATGYPALALLGYSLLVAGLAFKVTLVPFHAWAVDVYDGAPSDVSAFLAGGTKKIGLFAFFLVFLGPMLVGRYFVFPPGALNEGPSLQLTFAALAVLTMSVGNVLALLQKEMKRMLAYSSISQAGYMLIGLAVGTAPAIAGATLQIFAHIFMKTGAFLVVAAVAGLGIGPLIDDWRGLGYRRPYLSVSFALMLLSLAGIPLTIGFASKFVLFSSAIQAQGAFVWLAVAGLLNSAISVFYYARVLKVMYLEPTVATPRPAAALVGGVGPTDPAEPPVGRARQAAIALITIAIVAFGIYPQPFLATFQSAAQHFLHVWAGAP